jgi:beta-alanine--pyruvate transaminase
MTGPENSIEMPHGYTYSAHPIACAAGLGTLKVYEDEGLLTRVGELAKYWEDGAHSLKDCPNVIDIRNLGLIAGQIIVHNGLNNRFGGAPHGLVGRFR